MDDVGGRNLSNTFTMSHLDPNNVTHNSLRRKLYSFYITILYGRSQIEVTYDNSRKVGTTPQRVAQSATGDHVS